MNIKNEHILYNEYTWYINDIKEIDKSENENKLYIILLLIIYILFLQMHLLLYCLFF